MCVCCYILIVMFERGGGGHGVETANKTKTKNKTFKNKSWHRTQVLAKEAKKWGEGGGGGGAWVHSGGDEKEEEDGGEGV